MPVIVGCATSSAAARSVIRSGPCVVQPPERQQRADTAPGVRVRAQELREAREAALEAGARWDVAVSIA